MIKTITKNGGEFVKNKNIVLLTIVIIVLATLILVNPFKKDVWDVNAEHFRESLNNISGDALIDDLSEFTPFEWDTLYSFTPYTSTDEIYEVIGYKWDKIDTTVSENMNQIVFVKDGKVVCYIYGYPENTKLGFDFGEYEGNYIKLISAEKQSFELYSQKNNLKFLIYDK